MGTRLLPNRTAVDADLGTVNNPTSGSVKCAVTRRGPYFRLDFTLTAARIPVHDSGGSGSTGSLKLFDFAEGGVAALSCRQDYTAFSEGTALTTTAGDAAFVLGLGSVAVGTGSGALATTSVDWGASTATLTNSSGTTTGTKFSATTAAFDGTSTASDIYLNWSGTAATIDADSNIDVTGTITVCGVQLGDD